MWSNGETLQVRINLGAGEASLGSTSGLRLDDGAWHEVELHRTEAELRLTIDGLHSTYLDIPGRFFELNVKFGVFLGGLGPFTELFLGNLRYLRGCLDHVLFNDHDVLKMAAEQRRRVFGGVTWDCSEEFDAPSTRPISFVDQDSFMALPTWTSARSGGTLTFDLKTQADMAVLFYHPGAQTKTDFIAVEIINGKVTLSVNEGNGVVVLQSDVIVNDGSWHQCEIQFSPTYVQVFVDGATKNLRPGIGENRFFDLAGLFYVGGIELTKHSRALQNGLQSVYSEGADSSFQGCIKDLKLNNEVVGIQEAELSFGIKPDCVWDYLCLQDPCIASAECFQDGVDGFRCICDREICVQSNYTSGYKVYTKPSTPIDMELLSLRPLEVSEGSTASITTQQIQVALDYQKYGIRESGVIFRVVEPPHYGTLDLDIWQKLSDNIFTLVDLSTDKVRYRHDGSEIHSDSIILDLEFKAKNIDVPSFLEEKRQFVFHIQISPVNDPPNLILPPGKVLKLAKHTKILLTPDILDVDDPDSKPKDLFYTVTYNGEEGFIENNNDPGKLIDKFTQEDINDGLISYVHRGPDSGGMLTLQVSDGLESTSPMVLRISTFELVISLINNTGIILPYDSSTLITTANLTFSTNSPEQALDVRYEVVKQPQHGVLQKFKGNEKWQTVSHFSQKQMRKERIRYLHTKGRPIFDEFKFTVSCMDVKVPTVHDFRISFIAVKLHRVSDRELVLEKVLESHLTSNELLYETEPVYTASDQIVYILQSVPSYGNLMLFKSRQHMKMDVGSSFSQQDVDSKRVKYKLHRRSYSTISDQFHFEVTSPGGIGSDWSIQKIRHVPGDTDAVIINDKLTVLEGGEVTVTKSHLNLEIPRSIHILYNITSQPKSGIFKILSPNLSEVQEYSPSVFSTEHLEGKRLIYVHDDSENDRDSAQFVAYPRNGHDGTVYYGTLHVAVIMKNDNPPVRDVEKVFHVVTNGTRKLTGDDLRYVDADVDSKPTDIQYTRRAIPNGALYHVDTPDTQVFLFNQQDLNEGNILFKHSGPEYGKAILWITDGKYHASGILEVQASQPFVHLPDQIEIVAKRGESTTILESHLPAETNLNVRADAIVYKITTPPKYGEILKDGKGVIQFTQLDLKNEVVEYENSNNPSFNDGFGFEITVENVSRQGYGQIRVYPEIYWEPLKVLSNSFIYVDEGQAVTIEPGALKISHANIDPGNITYYIRSPPQHGRLFLRVMSDSDVDGPQQRNATALLDTFTQAAIDDGMLVYQQSDGRNITEDFFTFDASNGITQLDNLTFKIVVVSKVVLLRAANLTVREGGTKILTPEDLEVVNPYYAERVTEFLVAERPQHGGVTARFSPEQLRSGVVRYTHDGSETSSDWFTVVARAAGSESAPATLHVHVEAVNDEAPYVVNNTGLTMWQGSVVPITPANLAAKDDDSAPADICFVISAPSNGYVAFRNDTKTPVASFTQADITRGIVVFVHTGNETGGFRLRVHDGLNYDSPTAFTVAARPLNLRLARNEKLAVLPRLQQSITRDHLLATTDDPSPSRTILYRVVREPHLGRILLENPDGSLAPASTFTQGHVDRNLVLYEQTEPMAGLLTTDEFLMDVETQHAAPLRNVAFRVEISVGNLGTAGGLDSLIRFHTVEVREGRTATIGQEHIDLTGMMDLWQGKGQKEFFRRLKIAVHDFPIYGVLDLKGHNYTSSSTKMVVSREDIRKRVLKYHHDNSETTQDNFTLGFYLSGDEGIHDILLFNGTLNITILPVNDNDFVLETQNLSINVVRGQRVAITPHFLRTTDEDNSPKEIVYEMVGRPNHGVLMMQDSNTSESIFNFTQDDINRRLIFFEHDGSQEPGFFNFKVSDGYHRPVYKTFTLVALPLTLNLVNHSMVELVQGSTTTYIQMKHIGVDTNGNKNDTWFNITTHPRYGRVFIEGEIITNFKQQDLESNFVYYYMPLDLAVSEDYFEISIINQDIVIKNVIINVTVVPFIEQHPFSVTPGSILHITLEVLNATNLAIQTKSNPKYTLFTLPHYGSLYRSEKRTKRRYQARIEISEFTHEDVVNESIFYKSQPMQIEESVVDTFEYFLTAPGVQPSKGKYSITIQLPRPPVEDDPGSNHTAEMDIIRPRISKDHLLIIVMIIGMLLVLTLLVIFFRWCSIKSKNHKESRSEVAKTVGNHTAEAEPDDQMHSNGSASLSDYLPPPVPPTSPTGSLGGKGKPRTGSEPPPPPPPYLHDTPEWSEHSSVPPCKVTPLGQNEPISNETTLKGAPRYTRRIPSDLSDTDNWSPYDPENTTRYPDSLVLRKNQYWV